MVTRWGNNDSSSQSERPHGVGVGVASGCSTRSPVQLIKKKQEF
jgi:hypothetical protein